MRQVLYQHILLMKKLRLGGANDLLKIPELGSGCQSAGDPSTFLQSPPSLPHMTVLPRTPKCPFMDTEMGTPPPQPPPTGLSDSSHDLSGGWQLGFQARE